MTWVRRTKEVEVEIELDDVVEYIEDCDDSDLKDVVLAINKSRGIDIKSSDSVYEEVLSSDSWESRDKIAFLKTIFDKMSLDEMKRRLS